MSQRNTTSTMPLSVQASGPLLTSKNSSSNLPSAGQSNQKNVNRPHHWLLQTRTNSDISAVGDERRDSGVSLEDELKKKASYSFCSIKPSSKQDMVKRTCETADGNGDKLEIEIGEVEKRLLYCEDVEMCGIKVDGMKLVVHSNCMSQGQLNPDLNGENVLLHTNAWKMVTEVHVILMLFGRLDRTAREHFDCLAEGGYFAVEQEADGWYKESDVAILGIQINNANANAKFAIPAFHSKECLNAYQVKNNIPYIFSLTGFLSWLSVCTLKD
ncbi:hypothetical protein BC830DRAFT_1220853 [Chytriomyces sp. MP71]|nr:hypothetical protein BC830DRAFT_1220853 [Chytriomyces sp. MP71]